MRATFVLALVVATSTVSCGRAPSSTTEPAAPSKAAQNPPGMSRLGHFSTADGMIHLVIDRTGDKVKIRVDGSSDIIELTQDEVRSRRGDLLGYAFIAPDGARMLFIDTGGGVSFVKGATEHRSGDELPLVRDADAEPLGVATVRGAPPGPKPPERSQSEIVAEELAQISVVKRFPQFKPEDAGDLAKVTEAYKLVTADMLMHCTDVCAAWYAPHPLPGGNGKGGLGFQRDKDLRQGPATEAEKKAPLAKFNAWLRPDYEFGDWTHQIVKSSWLSIFQLEFRRLQPKSPVVVWDVEGTEIIVVTPDGSRYWDSPLENGEKRNFAKGIPPRAEWPAPMRNNLLFLEHVKVMGERGIVDKKLADELEGIRKKWNECAQQVFVPAQKEIEGNLTGTAPHYAASNRNDLVRRKYNDKAMKECGGNRAAAILVEILAKRDKDQRALFEQNAARLSTLR
ncbi:MAG: hypothetical protein KF764_24435 [Labilithrix sp.]|nr:hypothetical protein [Labilithrix sp.]